MAGYDDTRNKILESLLQRPVGTEINPENHQDFALSLLDYIRSVELISGSTLIGIAYQDTVPVQSNDSNGVYIAGVAQGSTVVFQNFRDVNGNQLTVTTEDTESKLVILIWNRQYWSKHEISANVVSQAENAYYNLTIRKQYESVYAMNSDKNSPIGNDGRAIRRGEIVSVRNLSNSNENGLYSYELNEYKIPYWQLQTKLSTLADRIIDGGGASGRLDLIQNRRDTNENWEEQNPVLAEGEIGFVVDQNYYKIGNGVSSWKNLQRIGYYDVDVNKWLEYDRKNIYSLQEGAGCLQFDGFTEVAGLGGILYTKDGYLYEVLYSTTSKSFILSVVDVSDDIGKKVGNFLFWPEIKTETKTIPSSESYKRRDVLFYIFTPNVGSVYYYIDDDGNASEKSSTYIIKKQLDSVKNSIIKKATIEYYDHSITDGPDRINTRANFKFLDADGNQLFNAVLLGAGNGYPGLLSLRYKQKLDNYSDTFANNPVASSESNGLMSADDKSKLDGVDEVIDLPWNDDVNGQDGYVNNFTERGEYHIHGERLYEYDGLPILNAASGHTIDGRMTVLDSSLQNGNKYDVCVTQILRLNNRVGGDGHIFIRTGIAATKAELQKPTAGGWYPWEKIMGVFEKNVVSSASDLDKYTSSGMYDGMFVFSSASQTISGLKIESGSTFLMVVVNGYAVASAGVVPQVTQLLYLMPSGLDGSSGVRSAKVYTRTGIYVEATKTYTWGKFDGLAHASDIAKIDTDLQEKAGYIQENEAAITTLEKITSALQGSVNSIKEHGLSDVTFIQEEEGSLSVKKLDLQGRTTASEFPLATTTAAGLMSADDKIKLDSLESPSEPDYAEMIIEAETAKHYRLFYDVRCIGWLEIDGEEAELPVITEDRAASYYAALSSGRHVVRFKPKEGTMSDGTPYKERQGLLGWCGANGVTEITLPEGWAVLNIKMFEGAESLRRVNLPSTITEVRYGAFGGCTALEEIVLPTSVETINHVMAHDCPALKRIVLGGRDISAYGTLAQTCAALECVEFRAGGTVAFTSSNNTFVNLPQLARFIAKGNLPTFECSQPFTSTGYVGSAVSADNRWLFTSDGETPSGTKWQTSLMSQCGFTVKKLFSYTLA